MTPLYILLIIAAYFGLLILVSFFTGKSSSNDAFFKGNKQSPWYVVAFGMLGASLSGVTFISVPGWVAASKFSYMQMVLGYVLGYLVIIKVLLPLYYKLNLTSIYTYLQERFGNATYKTGASFFLLSRIIGASCRLFLVAKILQLLIFDELNIPFSVTVAITILLIWLYTFKSGIKTIVWTDTLQTLFMLIALGVTIVTIYNDLNIGATGLVTYVSESSLSKVFYFDNPGEASYFWKQFLSGAFITIVMTGLDQDMMQKNLTCRSLKDAQKNMFSLSLILVVVNFIFLTLGLLLTEYATANGIEASGDTLFPTIAQNNLGSLVFIFFFIGLIAAAYSSADSALTSLTTSFSIDILEINKKYDEQKQVKIRKQIHILISFILFLAIIILRYVVPGESIIDKLFSFAGYTYGPLLGLYSFGLITKAKVKDVWVPLVAIASPIISYIIDYNCTLNGHKLGYAVLMINGLLTFIGLLILVRRK
ncbi:sodium:solute symporter [Neptunitalea lumnitzerae]|uniref:Solute:sodium symporter family transporter n=1 Tax=Neptunitalea lumnitzerae TaxID=2965509 RepID=A0ABQ5MHY3_9FLAO|nr:sodium:solute symporter [Neptunitalea sp. Y10]GLB48967.1 solute:sodium symporter family transporter [Neptunitalea sp. Y10]